MGARGAFSGAREDGCYVTNGTVRRSDYLRNAIAMATDSSLFYMAMSFIGVTTVFPAFLATLTDSELVIGVGSGITRGAWHLPQLLVAGMVTRLVHRKSIIVGAAWASRPILPLIALIVWRYSTVAPTTTLVLVLALLFVLFAADAVVSVPWFDHLARTIPAEKRGIVVGTGQVVGGLGGIGAGALVAYVLSGSSRWSYPENYAVIFGVGGIVLVLSAVAISFISNPECKPQGGELAPSPRQIAALLPGIMRRDRPFRRLVAVQLLAGFVGIASAFYVLYARRVLGFVEADTGLFVSAQVIGSMTAGFLLGYIQNRWGPLIHVRIQIIVAMAPPLLALLAGPAMAVSPAAGRAVYLALYFALGLYLGGFSWPFFNWILEYAPEVRRPLYIGLTNTLGAATMLAPALGGWVVSTISYPAVFALAIGFSLLALGLSVGLPSTRAATAAAAEAA
jgi:MFS family permease